MSDEVYALEAPRKKNSYCGTLLLSRGDADIDPGHALMAYSIPYARHIAYCASVYIAHVATPTGGGGTLSISQHTCFLFILADCVGFFTAHRHERNDAVPYPISFRGSANLDTSRARPTKLVPDGRDHDAASSLFPCP